MDLPVVERVGGDVVGLLDLISFRYLVDNRLISSAACFAEMAELTISTPYHDVFSV
jgi:hypothetical protein